MLGPEDRGTELFPDVPVPELTVETVLPAESDAADVEFVTGKGGVEAAEMALVALVAEEVDAVTIGPADDLEESGN